MAKLLYSAIASLDGYVADADGNFDWAMPSEEVHTFVNDLERPIGTYLFGQKMYEVMTYWEDPPDLTSQPSYVQDYARIWRSADKVVYSSSLETVSTPRTRLEHRLDPEAVLALKVASDRDLSVGGPTLAAYAFRAGLVDECHLFLTPVIVGGGTRALPEAVRMDLALQDERRFGNGVVHLHYRTLT